MDTEIAEKQNKVLKNLESFLLKIGFNLIHSIFFADINISN